VKAIKLDPVEWDFRELAGKLNKEHLWILIDYEYAREDRKFVERVKQWKQTTISNQQNSSDSEGKTRLNQTSTIKELLLTGFDRLPESLQSKIVSGFPGRAFCDLEWLVHFPRFPKPFAYADSGWRSQRTDKKPVYFARAGQRLNVSPWSMAERLQIAIEWNSFTEREIATALKNWVYVSRPEHAIAVKKQGERLVVPERLKWLAALRLEQHENFEFDEIRSALRLYRNDNPVHVSADVLPRFERKQAWEDAVQKARHYLDTLTP
jgi:hypothetical protein